MQCEDVDVSILDEISESLATARAAGMQDEEMTILLSPGEWAEFKKALNGLTGEEWPFESCEEIEFNGATIQLEDSFFRSEADEKEEDLFATMLNAISDYLDFVRKAA